MQDSAVIDRIKELCSARSWTCYRLAKESGIAYSTLNTMLNKTNAPSIPTLARICDGFGISLAQFFAYGEEAPSLPPEEQAVLDRWNQLNSHGKELAAAYVEGLLAMQDRPAKAP